MPVSKHFVWQKGHKNKFFRDRLILLETFRIRVTSFFQAFPPDSHEHAHERYRPWSWPGRWQSRHIYRAGGRKRRARGPISVSSRLPAGPSALADLQSLRLARPAIGPHGPAPSCPETAFRWLKKFLCPSGWGSIETARA